MWGGKERILCEFSYKYIYIYKSWCQKTNTSLHSECSFETNKRKLIDWFSEGLFDGWMIGWGYQKIFQWNRIAKFMNSTNGRMNV